MRRNRDAYKDAIDRIRSEHPESVRAPKSTVQCPRCGTKQQLQDVPGMRYCMKCGFEFRPQRS